MAFSNFIPEVWSARLLEHLDKVHVYANLMNRDYEGEIRAFGDTVHINQVGAITISDYTGADLSTPEELDSTMQDLAIDKAKYFNFQIKDVDNAQSNPKLVDAAMQRASYGMNDVIDQYLASLLVSGVDAGNILADDSKAVTPTSATAYDYLVDVSVKLDEANVPMPGRWVVVPPWYHGLLLKDPRFVGNGTGYNQAILQGGLVGEAAAGGAGGLSSGEELLRCGQGSACLWRQGGPAQVAGSADLQQGLIAMTGEQLELLQTRLQRKLGLETAEEDVAMLLCDELLDAESEILLYLGADTLEEQFFPKTVELAALYFQRDRRELGESGLRSASYTEGQISQTESYLTPKELRSGAAAVLESLARYRRVTC